MRRSVSRASKISTDPQDSLESSFSGIPDAKWHEFLEKEDNDLFILGLREEIIQKCLDICFERYMEKQAVAFTVHCAYLAWCKVINMYYMVRDPGDMDDSIEKETWKPDLEPKTSIIDSWGSECIMTLEPTKVEKVEEKIESESTESVLESKSQSLEPCSFVSNLFDRGESGEYFFFSRSHSSFSESSSAQGKSIFSRTLSMSREQLLPLISPLEAVKCSNVITKSKKSKK